MSFERKFRWGLLLSGGFALGPVQLAPALKHIRKWGMPEWICGTSVGAVNGAMLGKGTEAAFSALDDEWRAIDGLRSFQAMQPDFWNGVYSLDRAKDILKRNQAGRDLACPVYVGMVDVATQLHELVPLERFHHKAIIASATQPFLHERVKYMGRWKMDGGADMVLPPHPEGLADMGLDSVVAVFCSPVRNRVRVRTQEECDSGTEQLMVYLEMAISRTIERDFQRVVAASSIVPHVVYAPDSWEQVGRNNDASNKTILRRLNDVGPWMADNPMNVGFRPPARLH